MKPGRYDLDVWIGNTTTLRFDFLAEDEVPFDLTGSELVLTIISDGSGIRKSSATGDILIPTPEDGTASLTITVAESRNLIARLGPARYEIERRIGDTQRTLLYGEVRLKGGINDD